MFPKNKKDQRQTASAGVETILGTGTKAEGTLSTKGDLFVGGEFKGKIECGGNVVINKGVKVEADIHAVNVIVHGEVSGDVTASETVEVGNSGGIHGNVKAGAVRVSEGGNLVGTCTISASEAKGKHPKTGDHPKPQP